MAQHEPKKWSWQSDLLLARLELLVLLLRNQLLDGASFAKPVRDRASRRVRALRDEQLRLLRTQVEAVERELRPFLTPDPLARHLERQAGLGRWEAVTVAHFHRTDPCGAEPRDELLRRIGEVHGRLLSASGSSFALGAGGCGAFPPLPLSVLVAVLRKGGARAQGHSWMELEPEVEQVLAAAGEPAVPSRARAS